MILRYKIIFAFLFASYIGDSCLGDLTCDKQGHMDTIQGCPKRLPVIAGPSIIAGRTWIPKAKGGQVINSPTYKIPELGCEGQCLDWYSKTKTRLDVHTPQHVFVSVMVNSGCILHVFESKSFTGKYKNYTGPVTIINPEKKGPITSCEKDSIYKNMPCVGSMVWSCKQTKPTCNKFSDEWQTIAVLDNSLTYSDDVQFSYEKNVGTEFSQSIKESKSVGGYVSGKVAAEFWVLVASIKISGTAKYDWSKIDKETKSEMKSFNVNVKVPNGKKIKIEEVVGKCEGDNGEITSIHTQMFRVIDAKTEKVIRTYNGKMNSYKISTKKGKGKG